MSNEPTLSVGRGLLERIARPLKFWSDKAYRTKAIIELRALLDKPECDHEFELPVLSSMPEYCAKCHMDKPAAQHQGEPVAVVIDEDQSFAMWMHEAVEFTHSGGKVSKIQRREIVELSEERWALDAWKGRAKLAGKSAPVAVVMPGRMNLRSSDGSETYETKSWNAALDAVERLNGVRHEN